MALRLAGCYGLASRESQQYVYILFNDIGLNTAEVAGDAADRFPTAMRFDQRDVRYEVRRSGNVGAYIYKFFTVVLHPQILAGDAYESTWVAADAAGGYGINTFNPDPLAAYHAAHITRSTPYLKNELASHFGSMYIEPPALSAARRNDWRSPPAAAWSSTATSV